MPSRLSRRVRGARRTLVRPARRTGFFACLAAGALLGAAAGTPNAAGAQPTAEWRGRVLEDSARHPVAGARLAVPKLGLVAGADSAGRFALGGLTAGVHIVVTSALGFRPDTTTIDVAAGEAMVQDVTLARMVTPLEQVHVTAPAARYGRGKMVEFEERRAAGIGHFLDRELLQNNRNRRTSEILASNAPGVDVRRGTKSRAWAVSGRAVSSGKCAFCKPDVGMLDASDVDAGAGPACYMDVWLDGTLVYDASSRGAPLFDLNSIQPDQIEAIEVYTSAAQMPAKFNRTAGGCGAVVIWTRI